MTSKRTELLMGARDRILDPDHWIKGTMIQLCNGQVSYCMLGTLKAESNEITGHTRFTQERLEALRVLSVVVSDKIEAMEIGIAEFNDSPDTTHAMVLDAFDKAITYSKELDDVAAD